MKTVKIFWLSISLAYWALLPQFYLVYDQGNRYSLSWTYGSYLAILAAILTVGGVFFLVAASVLWVAKRYSGLNHFIRNVLGGVAGAIFLRSIFSLLDKGDVLPAQWQGVVDLRTVKLGIYLLPFLGLTVCKQVAMNLLRIVSLGVTVLLVLFLLLPWFWPTYGWDAEAPSAPAEKYATTTNSIYIFLFDAWSFNRTISDRNKMANMPGLSELLSHADLYTQAQSCGPLTHISIPRFFYQTDLRMKAMPYDKVRKSVQHNELLNVKYNSIFDLTESHYKSVLGYYLYYPSIIGSKVDYCGRYNAHSDRTRNKNYFLSLLLSQTKCLRHMGIDLHTDIPPWSLDIDLINVQIEAQDKLLNMLTSLPPMNLAFFHIPVPHFPYQFRPDGSFRSPVLFSSDTYSDVAGYEDNLGYMDLIIKDISETLKRRGDYDSSLLIFLSDHTWGNDPDQPYPEETDYKAFEEDDLLEWSYTRHVPLVIKHPGQTIPRTYEQVVSCWDLHHLFSQYLEHPSKTMDFKWWTDEHLPSGQRILPVSAGGE